MGLFANGSDSKKNQAPVPDSSSGDRFSEGFELMFGKRFEELSGQLERIEAEAGDRLDCVEKTILRQEQSLWELNDKSSAALEREQDEHKRRKGADAEFRGEIARLRASLDSAVETLQGKREIFERFEKQSEAFDDLLRRFEAFEASSIGRSELASLFGSVAQRFAPDVDERV